MKINSRNKGATGEREFCSWLFEKFNIPMPSRNLEQVRSGGSDVIDVKPFYFEVKRCEKISLIAWWRQVLKATENAHDDSIVPVVAFRINRGEWEFLISAKEIGIDRGFLRVSERVFLKWSSPKIIF